MLFLQLISVIEQQIHAFSNASTKGYGGVIHLRQRHEDTTITITLVTPRTRVAPPKQQMIPKLQLSAALLTSKLLQSVAKGLRIPSTHLHAWTDSTIV